METKPRCDGSNTPGNSHTLPSGKIPTEKFGYRKCKHCGKEVAVRFDSGTLRTHKPA